MLPIYEHLSEQSHRSVAYSGMHLDMRVEPPEIVALLWSMIYLNEGYHPHVCDTSCTISRDQLFSPSPNDAPAGQF